MINYTGIYAREILNEIIHEEIILELLGTGSNGTAYKFDDKVIKFTNSDGEYDCTQKLKSLQDYNPPLLDYTSKIYAYSKLSEDENKLLSFNKSLKLPKSYKYIIITDYLNTSKKYKNYFAKDVFGNILNYCFMNKISLSEVIKNNKDHVFDNEDCNRVLIFFNIEKLIGAQDLHSGNVGYDDNGMLKAFDFDYRNK